MSKLKVLELFGGIGACSKALERLGIDYEIADYVEIDKYAVKSFNAMHGTNFEPQDVCKWNKDIEVDLIMHGSPCQDFSLAGLQAGGDEGSGTRSSLMYETIRIVEKLKPKYVIWENVKNVISKKHKHNYDNYCNKMTELGYANYGQVLNAKDYGIPQNRERVFTISIRKDLNQTFQFPAKQELKLRLKDMLEDEVDEKYIISDKLKIYYDRKINQGWRKELHLDNKIVSSTICNPARNNINDTFVRCIQVGNLKGGKWDKINESCRRIYSDEGLSPTIHTCQGGNTEPKVIGGIGEKKSNGGTQWYQQDRIYDNNVGLSLSTTAQPYYPDNNLRIRKLTPKECWRLMGFDDEDFEKAEKVNSNAQLYKQAGNSIVVNVLEAILKELL
jgi:DNA (cytosine-5)-methyltransferase 1